MEHFHYRNKCQIGHFFMNFHYERYENVKKSVPPKFKNEASDHLKKMKYPGSTVKWAYLQSTSLHPVKRWNFY